MTKAPEATADHTRKVIVRLLDQMLHGYVIGQTTNKAQVARVGRFLLVDIGHYEALHYSAGTGEGEIYFTRQPIKSVQITFQDPPEIVAAMKNKKKSNRVKKSQ